MSDTATLIAFKRGRRIARGTLREIEDAVRAAADGDEAAVVVLDAETSAPVDIPLHAFTPRAPNRSLPRRPGRPKLGVTSREVSLLPRHWNWLADQPGGASAALRRLVEQARRSEGSKARKRQTMEAVDRFMHLMAGDLPNFEAASRAFYQNRQEDMRACMAAWPNDIRSHLDELLQRHWGARRV